MSDVYDPPPILTVSVKVFPVVEVFGPTIQGEGALAGVPSHFVRFGGCDFACAWCDSAHAVLPENVRQVPKITVSEIRRRIINLPPNSADWVTLSGGNPALHELGNLVTGLHTNGYKVAVETQGSKWKPWLGMVDLLTVSPKPPSSGMANPYLHAFLTYADKARRSDTVLGDSESKLVLKVPVYDEDDLTWALQLHNQYDLPFYISVVTEMGGLHGDFADGRVDTSQSLLARYQLIAESVLRRGVSDVTVIPQLHYLIWGNRIGV